MGTTITLTRNAAPRTGTFNDNLAALNSAFNGSDRNTEHPEHFRSVP